MITTIVSALLPVVFVLALGFFAGKRRVLPDDAVTVIIGVVLDFALPCGLFISTVNVSRHNLIKDAPLVLAFALTVVIFWIVMFGLGRLAFHHTTGEASLQALAVAMPAVPFYGLAVLGAILGAAGNAATGIGSIIINVLPVPATQVGLSLGTATQPDVASGSATRPSAGTTATRQRSGVTADQPHPTTPHDRSTVGVVGKALVEAIRAPYILAPIIGVVLVLVGIQIQQLILQSMQLIGQASSGLGLFVGGLILASVKLKITRETCVNVVAKLLLMPALFIGLAALLHLSKSSFDQGLLQAAIPAGPLAALLATRHKLYQSEASAVLMLTTIGFIITLPVALAAFSIS